MIPLVIVSIRVSQLVTLGGSLGFCFCLEANTFGCPVIPPSITYAVISVRETEDTEMVLLWVSLALT